MIIIEQIGERFKGLWIWLKNWWKHMFILAFGVSVASAAFLGGSTVQTPVVIPQPVNTQVQVTNSSSAEEIALFNSIKPPPLQVSSPKENPIVLPAVNGCNIGQKPVGQTLKNAHLVIDPMPEGKAKAQLKAEEVAKQDLCGLYTKDGVTIDIESIQVSDYHGQPSFQIYARAWRGLKPLGFSEDGSVEFERFVFINPVLPFEDTATEVKNLVVGKASQEGKEDTQIVSGKHGNTLVIQTFTADGTFTVTSTVNVDYLVVGGGGGGCSTGGGGGAGGAQTGTYIGVTSSLSVVIGAGGAGGPNHNGASSTLGSLVIGYAGGGCWDPSRPGGSGQGGANIGSTAVGGAGFPGQGYAGGQNFGSGGFGAGGGGGAGGVGADGTSGASGAGGVGTSTAISGSNTFYAGGGGGPATFQGATVGAGGNGGGGQGATSYQGTGTAGGANTGGGGGGSHNGTGGAGGSGIVITSYTVPAGGGGTPGTDPANNTQIIWNWIHRAIASLKVKEVFATP